MKSRQFKPGYFKTGEHYVWLSAGAIAIALIMVCGLLSLIAANGMKHFWPHAIVQQQVRVGDAEKTIWVLGEVSDHDSVHEGNQILTQTLIRVGNRDVYGQDFRWFHDETLLKAEYPANAVMIERSEWGNLYGFVESLRQQNMPEIRGDAPAFRQQLDESMARVRQGRKAITELERGAMSDDNYRLEALRMMRKKLELNHIATAEKLESISAEEQDLKADFETRQLALAQLNADLDKDVLNIRLIDGQIKPLPMSKVMDLNFPNEMSMLGKLTYFGHRVWGFLTENPRESNTEGGVFPAIIGTVTMVLLMSIIVTPFGVIAAVYLHEYAKQNAFTRLIRIAVNNLAGVPSIVYGVFGLGFFVYFLGGHIDSLFFPEAKPAPTLGTPGLLWASLTLALLTLPVVIVSTEEGLARVPKAIREGSLALGATKIETLWRTVLPMASPAMMTGLILAVARAAGEVAPLMLVGVVKLSPGLPVDLHAPFLHLDRKFMHLGFQIYDVGFQSPNVEAARPLVYASALLLVLVTVLLNIAAISLRNRLREKYKSLEH